MIFFFTRNPNLRKKTFFVGGGVGGQGMGLSK